MRHTSTCTLRNKFFIYFLAPPFGSVLATLPFLSPLLSPTSLANFRPTVFPDVGKPAPKVLETKRTAKTSPPPLLIWQCPTSIGKQQYSGKTEKA